MKGTGIYELLIILVALVAGMSLFLMCYRMAMSDDRIEFMDDKSVWDYSTEITYEMQDGVLVPATGIVPIDLNLPCASAMMLYQDEYTPNTARSITYNYDATTETDTTLTDLPRKEFTVSVPDNTRASRYVRDNIIREVCTDNPSAFADVKHYYIVWNYELQSWMITNKYVNIYDF